ncbi:aldolase [Paenibacillus sp. N4]|uniref:aldolase n=1 Tax=Paenibacillus vietnamensis TaxID=2590547 RepID=UPI001CD0F635|nr:aldolase [Paenibacillus vietnamensis]MCA0755403.1 aldolase [Paenibacillus vietnamensis]
MIGTAEQKLYRAFGLKVSSGFEMPELPEWPVSAADSGDKADIEITVSDLTELWEKQEVKDGIFKADGQMVIFQIPDVAIFCIREGSSITVSPMTEDRDQIRLYVLGSCMGVLLLQRKILPLHGSAIAIDGKAYAFVGESGAGKSTLASALLRQGHRLLSDDVIAVSLQTEQELPYVTPSFPQQKLWQESLDHFGMDSSGYRPIYQRETKFSVPVVSDYFPDPLPLAGLFELVKGGDGKPGLRSIPKLESLPVLYRHTFRNFLVNHLDLTGWHLGMTAKLVPSLSIYRIFRPETEFTVPELTALILTTIKKGG